MRLFRKNKNMIYDGPYEFTLYKTYFLNVPTTPKKERLKLVSFVSYREEKLYDFLSKFEVEFQEIDGYSLKLGVVYLEVKIETNNKLESKYFLPINNFRMNEILNVMQKKGENI